MGDGTVNMSVKELSNIILNQVSNICELRYIKYENLIKIKGIGISKACSLLAAIELGNRINARYKTLNNIIFKDTKTIFEYYKNKIGYIKQEVFYAVYLDASNRIIKEKELFKGTLNFSLVHPREIFREAYYIDAVSIICIHNHPTGNIVPSREDIELTKRLINVSQVLGIRLLDHLIIGSDSYYSFYENGDI